MHCPSRLQFDVYADLHVELLPVHSPLLGESLLVSFPPLSYMLKFSGSSYLISGQSTKMGLCWGGSKGREALPPWPKSTHRFNPDALLVSGRERGRGRAYTGVVESPSRLVQAFRALLPHRAVPLSAADARQCRRGRRGAGKTRRLATPRARRGGEGSQARLSGSLHASGDVGECAGGNHPAVKRGEAASPHEAHGPPQGSRLGEGVTTLKQAYSEECHVRSKT